MTRGRATVFNGRVAEIVAIGSPKRVLLPPPATGPLEVPS